MSTPKQALILDPSGIAPEGRSELGLSGYLEGVEVAAKGLDLGDQLVKAFMAEGLFGSKPIDHVWPLVPCKIPLLIRATESLTFDQVRAALAAKVADINDSGAILKRVLPSGVVRYADVVEAKLTLSASWLAEHRDTDLNALLELQRLPEWYGDEVTSAAHEFTGDGAFTIQVGGDMPARVTNMQVEDKSGNEQLGLMFHYRGRNYSSANTAEWAYNAEALGLLDLAEKATNPGGIAYGSKVVKHPKLSTEWTPVLSTNKGGTTFLTHAGLYLVWGRVWSSSEDLPWLRLVYGAGDVIAPSELTQLQVPGREGWYDLPLGLVNIPTLPFGAQRWEGIIQARGETGTENIYIDRLRFQCADECSGALLAKRSTTALASVLASDSLVTHSTEGKEEALKGTEDSRGHKWEELGATEGFERGVTGLTRDTTSDSSAGRSALLVASIGPVVVKCEAPLVIYAEKMTRGFYLRYSASNYWVRVSFLDLAGERSGYVEYQAGGSVLRAFLGSHFAGALAFKGELNAAGEVVVQMEGKTYRYTLPATFRKGEAHAEGEVGIFDYNPTSTPVTRRYLNFTASPAAPADAVMYANKAAYLSSIGNYRQSEDGLGASKIGYPGTDLPRLPVGSPVEIAVHPSRGQFGEVPDSGKDKFKVQMSYRECFAEIPAS